MAVVDLKIDTGNPELDEKLTEWLTWDKNPTTLSEVRALMETSDWSTLTEMLLTRLSFGTAGLRAPMRAGYNAMNDLVVLQTAQGLLRYVQHCFPKQLHRGFVIGYDGRYNSKRFAELTAAIFLHAGVPVYLFSTTVATPFIPHAVLTKGLLGGVMVTASHNPKEDNGYKVYWENGASIIPPHDKNIQHFILDFLKPFETSWDTEIINTSPLLKDPLPESMEHYYKTLDSLIPEELKKKNSTSDVEFTYSAMHGVGYPYIVRAFETARLKPVIAVQEQKDPDPEFPTVKFPNPEEGKSSLDLSIKTANEAQSDVILANDPDADRLACAEKQRTGEWRIFTGNELGALLGWWAFKVFKMTNPDIDLNDVYMLASTVSSKILQSIARVEGFQFEDTLTGFKWMGNRAVELLAKKKHVIFAFEEAIGFMWGCNVLDKDGVSAGALLATMVCYLKTKKLTLSDQLHKIYETYGYHVSDNSYYICHKKEIIQKIYNRLRNYDGEGSYPKHILSGKYTIAGVRDITTGYDSTRPNGKAVLPTSKSSQMLTFYFENGLQVTLRTSGTEPKLKYYTEMCAKPEQRDWNALTIVLKEMLNALLEEFLLPKENGLIERSL